MSSVPQSGFDPNLFLDATVTEVNEKRPPLPTENPASSDGLYTAVIGEVKMNSGTYDKGERIGQPWLQAIVPLTIEVPQQVQDGLGLKLEKGTLQFTDRPFIDLTPQKTIDNSKGKNRGQKMYREAADLNKPGDTFSWRMLQGKVVKVQIGHEMYEGSIQERIKNVLKA